MISQRAHNILLPTHLIIKSGDSGYFISNTNNIHQILAEQQES